MLLRSVRISCNTSDSRPTIRPAVHKNSLDHLYKGIIYMTSPLNPWNPLDVPFDHLDSGSPGSLLVPFPLSPLNPQDVPFDPL